MDPDVSALDFLRDGGSDGQGEVGVPVLSENWEAVAVFRRCRPSWLTGMHQPIYDGIPALEIEAAARLEQVPRRRYPDLLFAIDVLISATRQARSTPN